jgi:DNA polymerase I-like protein with 3'-5' exonuclease and polymerase domains
VSLVLTVDCETFYDKSFSLSKLTTEEYIRDPQFQVIGVSVAVGGGVPAWFSGTHAEIKTFLDQYDWESATAIAHNAAFDMAILNWVFDIRPKRIVDTLSMARALGHGSVSLKNLVEHYGIGTKGTEVVNALGKRLEDFTREDLQRYGEYCQNDVWVTYRLFGAMASGFPLPELKLIDLTIRMFTEPVLELDAAGLRGHLWGVQRDKQTLMMRISSDKDTLMSNPKFAEVLEKCGVTPPVKISKTTGKETYAFAKSDEAFIALLEHENPDIQTLVAARLGIKSTLEETRTERFIEIAKRGAMPVPLRYYGAHTGRWSGQDKINLQNLPRGAMLKRCILPPKGHLFLDSDSSQIEARTLAWLAGQNDLVEAFEQGKDVYKLAACGIYGVLEEEVDKHKRHVGKTSILSCGYGVGAARMKMALKAGAPSIDLPLAECQRIIDAYRATYAKIPELWRQAQEAIEAMIQDQSAPLGLPGVLSVEGKKGIRLPNGLYLRYPNLRKQQDKDTGRYEYVYDTTKGRSVIPTRLYGGKLIENVCQALARIIIGEQMLKIAKRYRVVLTVHDSVGCVVPEKDADVAKEFVELCMRLRPQWALGLPLNCEAGYGVSYGAC